MKRWLKALLWFVIIDITLLGASIAVVVCYIDPNQFKVPVQEMILARTGHKLSLEGPIRWKWYPMLSLEIKKLSLDNRAPFSGVLISADKLKVDLGLWPLLTGRVVCDFDLEGATLVLERDSKGLGNWAELHKAFSAPPPRPPAQETAPHAPSTSYIPSLALNNLRIQNAQLVYHDAQNNQHYMLNHLDLEARGLVQGVLKGSNPLSLAFQVDQLNKKPLGSVSLQGQWSLVGFSQLKLSDLKLRLTPSADQHLDLQGELQVANSTAFSMAGHLKSNAFKLSSLLQDGEWAHHPLLRSPLELETTFEYQGTLLTLNRLDLKNQEGLSLQGTLTADFAANPFLNKLVLKADLTADRLSIGSVPIENLKAQIQADKGVLTVAPLDFRLTGAAQHLELGLRLDSAQPQWSLKQQGEAFELKTLLASIAPNNPIEGKATLGMQLSAQGMQLERLEKTLAGKINLKIAQGSIHHIDLAALIKQALSGIHDLLAPLSGQPDALLDAGKTDATLATASKDWAINPLDTKAVTPFDSLTASMTLSNGIANNPDLRITHKDYTVTGSGSLDLVGRQLDYKASALLGTNPYPKTDEIGTFLFQSPLPIQIQGSLDAPSVKPDLKTYLNNAFKYLQKNKVEQIIHQTIDKTLGHFLKLKQQSEGE